MPGKKGAVAVLSSKQGSQVAENSCPCFVAHSEGRLFLPRFSPFHMVSKHWDSSHGEQRSVPTLWGPKGCPWSAAAPKHGVLPGRGSKILQHPAERPALASCCRNKLQLFKVTMSVWGRRPRLPQFTSPIHSQAKRLP